MTIKQGSLVKAWDYDPRDYVIGEYEYFHGMEGFRHVVNVDTVDCNYENAIEIPPALAKALEELGNE